MDAPVERVVLVVHSGEASATLLGARGATLVTLKAGTRIEVEVSATPRYEVRVSE